MYYKSTKQLFVKHLTDYSCKLQLSNLKIEYLNSGFLILVNKLI